MRIATKNSGFPLSPRYKKGRSVVAAAFLDICASWRLASASLSGLRLTNRTGTQRAARNGLAAWRVRTTIAAHRTAVMLTA